MSERKQLLVDTSGPVRVGKGFLTRRPFTCGCGEQNIARKRLTGVVKCTGCGAAIKVRVR